MTPPPVSFFETLSSNPATYGARMEKALPTANVSGGKAPYAAASPTTSRVISTDGSEAISFVSSIHSSIDLPLPSLFSGTPVVTQTTLTASADTQATLTAPLDAQASLNAPVDTSFAPMDDCSAEVCGILNLYTLSLST